MDVDEFSVSPFDLPRIKAVIRTLTHARARELAESALQLPTATAIRRMLERELVPLLPAALLGGDDA
jgi:phosphoenolpyruvate-protein kinase (PTS system EI component)